MILVDANAILRFILYDNHDMAVEVCKLLEKNKVFLRYEVIAEIVYVLHKVYMMPKTEICDCIKKVLKLPNVDTESEEVLYLALEKYAMVNIDFIDCILCSFNEVFSFKVFTFDKKLLSMLK